MHATMRGGSGNRRAVGWIAVCLGCLYAGSVPAVVIGDVTSVSHLSEPYRGYVPIMLEVGDNPKKMKIEITPIGEPIVDGAFGVNYVDSFAVNYSPDPTPRIVISSARAAHVGEIPFRLSISSPSGEVHRDMTIVLSAAQGPAPAVAQVPVSSTTQPTVAVPEPAPAAQGDAFVQASAEAAVAPPAADPTAVAAVASRVPEAAPVASQPPVEPVQADPDASATPPVPMATPVQAAPAAPAMTATPATVPALPTAETVAAGAVAPATTPAVVAAPAIAAAPETPAPPAPVVAEVANVAPVVTPVSMMAPAPAPTASEAETAFPVFVDVPPQQASGAPAQKARKAEEALKLKPGSDGSYPPVVFVPSGTLDHLRAAEGWRAAGSLKRSIEQYDAAESSLKSVETQSVAESGGRMLASLLVNDNMMSYTPSPSEAVLMNFEKALSFWALGDEANARVELNRAEDRTRRAVERYSAELDKAQQADAKNASVNTAAASPKVLDGVNAKIPEVAQWHTYSEFVNPAVTYLHALFLGRKGDTGDAGMAQNLMQRVVGIVGGNAYVEMDLADLKTNGRACPKDNCTWIMVEAGKGPILEERRVSTMFPSLGGAVYSVTVALPVLKSRSQPGNLRIDTQGGTLSPALLGDMDIVVQTEFSKRWPGIVARAVGGAAVKAIAQKEIADRTGPFGSLIGALGSVMVTHADTRMWDEMPGRWYLARVDGLQGSDVSLSGAGFSTSLHLPKGPALLYVKASDDAGTAPLIHTLGLTQPGKMMQAVNR